jgi:predicted DNA-binding transcriptional regulator AlpA
LSTEAIHDGPTLPELLVVEEVAELIRVPKSTLRYYRHSGQGGPRSFRLGSRVVYKRGDVLNWIESRYAESAVTSAGRC